MGKYFLFVTLDFKEEAKYIATRSLETSFQVRHVSGVVLRAASLFSRRSREESENIVADRLLQNKGDRE